MSTTRRFDDETGQARYVSDDHRVKELREKVVLVLLQERGRNMFYGCLNDDPSEWKGILSREVKVLVKVADRVARELVASESPRR